MQAKPYEHFFAVSASGETLSPALTATVLHAPALVVPTSFRPRMKAPRDARLIIGGDEPFPKRFRNAEGAPALPPVAKHRRAKGELFPAPRLEEFLRRETPPTSADVRRLPPMRHTLPQLQTYEWPTVPIASPRAEMLSARQQPEAADLVWSGRRKDILTEQIPGQFEAKLRGYQQQLTMAGAFDYAELTDLLGKSLHFVDRYNERLLFSRRLIDLLEQMTALSAGIGGQRVAPVLEKAVLESTARVMLDWLARSAITMQASGIPPLLSRHDFRVIDEEPVSEALLRMLCRCKPARALVPALMEQASHAAIHSLRLSTKLELVKWWASEAIILNETEQEVLCTMKLLGNTSAYALLSAIRVQARALAAVPAKQDGLSADMPSHTG